MALPYNFLFYSVTSLLLGLDELLHLCTCKHVWWSKCENYIRTLDQLHQPNSDNLLLYLPTIQLVQITQCSPHRLLLPRYSFFLLPAPPPSSQISLELNRINYLGRKHILRTSFVSISQAALDFFTVSTFCT